MEVDDKIIVDFERKDTEAGWIRTIDNFAFKATPLWFNWLSWILLMGVFQYFLEKSQHILAKIVLGIIVFISATLLWCYFNAVFFRLEFRGFPFITKPKYIRIASFILSGIMAFGSWTLALALVEIAKSSNI